MPAAIRARTIFFIRFIRVSLLQALSGAWAGIRPEEGCRKNQSLSVRNLSELAMTDTEDRLIAAAASIGDRSAPNTG